MSDYMPTTENVRRAWAWWRKPMMGNKDYYPDEESLFEVTDLELDRWLDEVKAEAWEEGYESAALRIPEGVWHDVAAPHPGNPYRQEQENE